MAGSGAASDWSTSNDQAGRIGLNKAVCEIKLEDDPPPQPPNPLGYRPRREQKAPGPTSARYRTKIAELFADEQCMAKRSWTSDGRPTGGSGGEEAGQ